MDDKEKEFENDEEELDNRNDRNRFFSAIRRMFARLRDVIRNISETRTIRVAYRNGMDPTNIMEDGPTRDERRKNDRAGKGDYTWAGNDPDYANQDRETSEQAADPEKQQTSPLRKVQEKYSELLRSAGVDVAALSKDGMIVLSRDSDVLGFSSVKVSQKALDRMIEQCGIGKTGNKLIVGDIDKFTDKISKMMDRAQEFNNISKESSEVDLRATLNDDMLLVGHDMEETEAPGKTVVHDSLLAIMNDKNIVSVPDGIEYIGHDSLMCDGPEIIILPDSLTSTNKEVISNDAQSSVSVVIYTGKADLKEMRENLGENVTFVDADYIKSCMKKEGISEIDPEEAICYVFSDKSVISEDEYNEIIKSCNNILENNFSKTEEGLYKAIDSDEAEEMSNILEEESKKQYTEDFFKARDSRTKGEQKTTPSTPTHDKEKKPDDVDQGRVDQLDEMSKEYEEDKDEEEELDLS